MLELAEEASLYGTLELPEENLVEPLELVVEGNLIEPPELAEGAMSTEALELLRQGLLPTPSMALPEQEQA